ncbi:restriction endonuclease subunit S (plasmid) [Rhodobacter capsulatus]|uniref:restriction endonuclease subunit S n=1 Tax=Rhodobacter capsulatus TaxID=1061 RepID=UPI0011440A6D|nr:restriction endonuclease subunit S [Rhodobacter capsulatus]TQD33353.1 restriction endonuclease subunit S [Rhodobacter capsulatus]
MYEPYVKLPLSKVARIERGKFSARPRNDPKYYGGEIPFLQTGDIARAGRIIQGWTQTLNELGLGVSKMFPRGTIFMSIAANIGDVAISGFDAACPDSVVAVKPRNGFDPEWIFQSLKFSKNDLAALSTQNAQANLSLEKIEPFKLPVPPLPEQRKIAEILRTWDEALEKLAALRAAKERRLSALRAALLFGRLRLGGRGHKWVPTRLDAVTHELTKRNGAKGLGRDFVMGITKAEGVVPMREQTIAGDISRYKRLPPRAFAYNPMRINVGSIAMNERGGEVLVSPDYVVFACNPDGLDPDYLDHLRKTSWWGHYINSGGSGSVRQRTYYDDLAALKLPLPELDEQKAIAAVLNTARDDLAATKREIEALTRQKRGLMQKLLTGEWRVALSRDKEQ